MMTDDGRGPQAQQRSAAFPQVHAPSIEMPKGGGAIRGIGEKLAANPVTGAGSMAFPIATTPGRAGFGPQLALTYDSSSGNGPLGFGWELSPPSVTRKTDKGLPRYHDAEGADVFILSGAEDLVPVLVQNAQGDWEQENLPLRTVGGVAYRVERFRPRVEGAFARIERWTDTADAAEVFWRSITAENITTWYGRTADSRIADPADPSRIFSWRICLSHDDHGNVIVYGYKAEDSARIAEGAAHERNRTDASRSAQRYLKRIRYGNTLPYLPVLRDDGPWPEPPDAFALDGSDAWRFEVVFDYGDHDPQNPTPREFAAWPARKDPFSSCRAGFEIRTYRTCQRVLMFHHFPGTPGVERDCLVRSTEFAYSDELDPLDDKVAVYTFLRSVSDSGYVRGGSGYERRSLPPLEFEYSEPVVQDRLETVDALDNLPVGLDGEAYRWIDLHGEGIPGILTDQAGAWFYKRNLSPVPAASNGAATVRARFAPLETVAFTPNTAGRTQIMDLAGDGPPDVVVTGATAGLYEHDEAEGWQPFRAFGSRLNRDLNDPNLRLVDLDGDGRADVLVSEEDAFVWHASLAEDGFGPARRAVKATDEETGPRIVFADGTDAVQLADFSGDGLTDIVRIGNGEVCYWPNLGHGRFGPKVTMDNAPWFDQPEEFDPDRIRLADIDGSGTTDLIYLHRDGVRLYFNQSGNGWSRPQTLKVFPRTDDLTRVAAIDLLGNGTACLVWSSSAPGSEPVMRYVNLMGDRKPHLLVRASNNLGIETRVEYAPSTRFYLQDRRDGRPWATRLPFPVHVVERVETVDHIGRTRFAARYAYHDGYFDGEEREFRGFGMVEQWDTEEFAALSGSDVPAVHTKTWFHTGASVGTPHGNPEYFREPGLTDGEARALSPADPRLPAGLRPEERREALRALKGQMLRQEVYADDAGEDATPDQIRRAATPYTAVEQSQSVRCVQPKGPNQHAVFLTQPGETIRYHYERNPADPRVQHVLTLEVDGFGNVLKEAVIGYGRRPVVRVGGALVPNPALAELDPADQAKQTTTLLTYTESRFTNAVDDLDVHRRPVRCESRSFELTGYTPRGAAGRFRASDFVAPDPAVPGRLRHLFDAEVAYEEAAAGGRVRRPIDWRRTLLRRDDLTGLEPLGVLPSLGLPGESYQLAFTTGLLAQAYQRPSDGPLLPNPAAVLAGSGADQGGYVPGSDLTADGRFPAGDPDDHWWIPSGRFFYTPNPADPSAAELSLARQHFFMPRRYVDAFGHDAVVDFDVHDLLMTETRDAVGNRVTVAANDYRLLRPRLVADPNGNRTEVAYDALGMVAGVALMGKPQPAQLEGDSLAGFAADLSPSDVDAFFTAADPHSLAPSLLGQASTRVIYDVDRFRRTRLAHPDDPTRWQPARAATLARETHASDPLPAQGLRIQITVDHSDGFGRTIQSKVQAAPGPAGERRWTCSGWTIFNNKGKLVRKYEPFFTATHDFEFAVLAGVSPVLFYDPVGRVVAVLLPDQTYEKAVFDAWRQKAYDVNDTCAARDGETGDPRTDGDIAGYVAEYFRTQPATWQTWYAQRIGGALGPQERTAAQRAEAHADTPTTTHFDALGRTFLTVARNRVVCVGHDLDGQEDDFAHRVELDIEGNQLALRDCLDAGGNPQGRLVERLAYDMAGNALCRFSMEAGARWTLPDVTGKPIRSWDSRGHTFTMAYDALRRPTDKTVRGTTAESDPRTLNRDVRVDSIVYGESAANPEASNLRTRVHQHMDSAGVVTNAYDFKGNTLRSTRRLVADYTAIPDWQADPQLEREVFESAGRFDALNRPTQFVAPHSSLEHATCNVIQMEFDDAGLAARVHVWLERASEPAGLLDPASETPSPVGVAAVEYDALGHRTRVDYKNGVQIFHTYDPLTQRLTDLLTRRDATAYPDDDPHPPVPGWPGRGVQSLHYTFDAKGNITHIRDDAQQTVFFRNRRVDPSNDYVYDAVYRLVQADGREHLGQGGTPVPHAPHDPDRVRLPHPGDGTAMGRYIEQYVYDAVGNIQQMRHQGSDPAHPGWTRAYGYLEQSLLEPSAVSNRLSRSTVAATGETFQYDAHGNLVRLPHLGGGPTDSNMDWDYLDRLHRADLGGGGTVHYLYDASGRRIRKVWEKAPGLTEERISFGGFELFRRHRGAIGEVPVELERQTLHVVDGDRRIALVETRTLDTAADDAAPRQLIRYQLGGNLGSVSVEMDDQARIISYEEYTPYGSTSYQAVRSQTECPKRYRYTGMERDEESGLSCHGARYYATWLGRFISCDPIGIEGGSNLYRYADCAPTSFHDATGMGPQKPPPTVKEQAAMAEDAGKAAMVKKYSGIDTVVDVTPNKDVSANGVDAHLIVGKGSKAINVIGDTKFAGPTNTGDLHPENYTGKEHAGHISSFDAAAKNNYAQLVRNIRVALKAGKIDPATAYTAIQGAKAGLVMHDVAVTGRTTGIGEAILERYQAEVTRVDIFAESAAKRASLDVQKALGKSPGKVPSTGALTKWFGKALPGGSKPAAPAAPPAAPPPEPVAAPQTAPKPSAAPEPPPGVVKMFGGMPGPGMTTLDPAPRGVGGVGVAVVVTFGPDIAVKIADKAGASPTVKKHVGFWSNVVAGGIAGGAAGLPEGGVGAVPGAVIGAGIGALKWVGENYEFCVPFYNCSD